MNVEAIGVFLIGFVCGAAVMRLLLARTLLSGEALLMSLRETRTLLAKANQRCASLQTEIDAILHREEQLEGGLNVFKIPPL